MTKKKKRDSTAFLKNNNRCIAHFDLSQNDSKKYD